MSRPDDSIFSDLVDQATLSELLPVHEGLPEGTHFLWFLNYRADAALHNIAMLERGAQHFKLRSPVRVFLSHWTDAILCGFVPLEAVKDPHVQEWFVTFYEVPLEDAKRRLTEFPRFPYDGRNADLVRAEMLADGTIQDLLKRSARILREKGIPGLSRYA